MEFFRSLVISTLGFVAVLAFIATIVLGAFGGYQNGPEVLAQFGLAETFEQFNLPSFVYAIVGAIIGWVVASVALGVLFVLIDIQDGIRDIHRDMVKGSGAGAPAAASTADV